MSTTLDHKTRSAITRDHALRAAVEVLIEDGYSGASTLRIQERAGMTRGRLLHQYPNRDQLLVAAAQHLAEARVHAMTELELDAADRAERIDLAVDAMWSTYHEGYFWAATELWLAARHNAALADTLTPGERALGREIRSATDTLFGDAITGHPQYAATRELLNTSMRGAALTYSFDPRDPLTDPHLPLWRTLAHERLGS